MPAMKALVGQQRLDLPAVAAHPLEELLLLDGERVRPQLGELRHRVQLLARHEVPAPHAPRVHVAQLLVAREGEHDGVVGAPPRPASAHWKHP